MIYCQGGSTNGVTGDLRWTMTGHFSGNTNPDFWLTAETQHGDNIYRWKYFKRHVRERTANGEGSSQSRTKGEKQDYLKST